MTNEREPVKISELTPTEFLNPGDAIVLSRNGVTLRVSFEQFAAIILGMVTPGGGGTTPDPGTGAPAFQLFETPAPEGQNAVILNFAPDETKPALTFRNGQFTTNVTRNGSVFTFPAPAFRAGEAITILAYPQ